MATVNYLYRSTKNEAYLNLRLLYRFDEKDFVIGAKTRLKVSREYWNTTHRKNIRNIRDVKSKNLYNEVNSHLSRLEDHVLNEFESVHPTLIDKVWLKSIVDNFYDPKETQGRAIPLDLVNYMEYYLERKSYDISTMSVRRIRVVKHKMERMQLYLNRRIMIRDINDDFKLDFQRYYESESYSPNTQQRELKMIKSVCNHAFANGLEVHPQLKNLKLKPREVEHIYLSFEEIKKIKELDLKQDHLDNARDWLVVSCFTGQRVSDFLRFTKEMIRKKGDRYLLEFTQSKTGKLMTIPVLDEVIEVLKKRNGDFPRAISDQKYNDYIKDVAEEAGLKELCEGKKRINIAKKGEKATYRDVVGEYPKWKLVSSHIGRRSFATNHYGRIPTGVLIGITGHSSEAQFLNYIQKTDEETAIDAFEHFYKS